MYFCQVLLYILSSSGELKLSGKSDGWQRRIKKKNKSEKKKDLDGRKESGGLKTNDYTPGPHRKYASRIKAVRLPGMAKVSLKSTHQLGRSYSFPHPNFRVDSTDSLHDLKSIPLRIPERAKFRIWRFIFEVKIATLSLQLMFRFGIVVHAKHRHGLSAVTRNRFTRMQAEPLLANSKGGEPLILVQHRQSQRLLVPLDACLYIGDIDQYHRDAFEGHILVSHLTELGPVLPGTR